MLTIDGSRGEGGGQVLRTALALSCVTGTPFRLERVRAGRSKPGLMRQHLACVRAAGEVSGARVTGDELGSTCVEFRPGRVQAGHYEFSVGSAGSATLVLQTVLPPLLLASGASRVRVEGGTHNPLAPPADFIERAYLPLVRRAGAGVEFRLERHGFYPAGGGVLAVECAGDARLRGFDLLERGRLRARRARALVANLARAIGQRELDVARAQLGLAPEELELHEVRAAGPGNVVLVEFALDDAPEAHAAGAPESRGAEPAGREERGPISRRAPCNPGRSVLFSSCGEKALRAEVVAARAAEQAAAWLALDVPVDAHLADQWLLILALGGGGRFRSSAPTAHTLTNADVIRAFLPLTITSVELDGGAWEIVVAPA